MVVQLSLRCSRAWRRLNMMVGSDSEASECKGTSRVTLSHY